MRLKNALDLLIDAIEQGVSSLEKIVEYGHRLFERVAVITLKVALLIAAILFFLEHFGFVPSLVR